MAPNGLLEVLGPIPPCQVLDLVGYVYECD